jgi:two-component sensor histidine kinase
MRRSRDRSGKGRADFLEWLFSKGGMKRSLLFPFLAIICLGIGAEWLMDSSVSRSILGSAMDELLVKTAESLRDKTVAYLDGAVLLAESNAALASASAVSLDGFRLALWQQLQGREDIDLACVAYRDGEYVEAERVGRKVRTGRAGKATGGALVLEAMDDYGKTGAVEFRKENYDPRQRPWYLAAKGAGRPALTPPYSLFSSGAATMAASVPFYDAHGLAGVCTADIRLGQISTFLAEASRVSGSLAFIVDEQGKLLASSMTAHYPSAAGTLPDAPGVLLSRASGGMPPGRVERLGEGTKTWRMTTFDLSGRASLPWVLVTAFPEESFLSRLSKADRYSVAILLVMLAITLALGFSAAHRVSRPLRRLGLVAVAFDPETPMADPDLGGLALRDDEIGRLAQAFLDMSGRLAESFSSLHASIGEKEVLLKELNHRVKNNLQIVSSLISSQADSITDEATRSGLESLQNRIQAMAYVHEDVFHSGDMGSIDMDRYLSRICESLVTGCVAVGSTGARSCPVFLEVESGGIFLSLDKALPCGLIVNELVANCLRHAFQGRPDGEVEVSLAESGDGGLILRVQDNGVGLQASREARDGRREGMGSSLVEALTSQLGGQMRVESGPGGTSYSLSFQGKPRA